MSKFTTFNASCWMSFLVNDLKLVLNGSSSPSSPSSISSACSCTPLTGPRLTLRSVSPPNCLKEVIESATLNPLCYPNSYLSELQPEAAVPDFH